MAMHGRFGHPAAAGGNYYCRVGGAFRGEYSNILVKYNEKKEGV
jgi:hypothetical protein